MHVNLLINNLSAKLCKHRDFERKFFGNNVRANNALSKIITDITNSTVQFLCIKQLIYVQTTVNLHILSIYSTFISVNACLEMDELIHS